jgi:hypothetical protein
MAKSQEILAAFLEFGGRGDVVPNRMLQTDAKSRLTIVDSAAGKSTENGPNLSILTFRDQAGGMSRSFSLPLSLELDRVACSQRFFESPPRHVDSDGAVEESASP